MPGPWLPANPEGHRRGSVPILVPILVPVPAPMGSPGSGGTHTPLAPLPSSGFRTPTRGEFRLLQPQPQPRGRAGCESS